MATFLLSCSTYTTGARREDFLNRCFSKTEIKAVDNWKMGKNTLILKRNNTFRYTSNVMGINLEYYTGTYERNADTIVFKFIKNNRFYIAALKDSACVGYIKNDRPAFFAKADTLILTQKNQCGQWLDILRNKNNGHMTVVQNTPPDKK